MDRHSLIEGLKSLEHLIVERLDKIDSTRKRLLSLVEGELNDRDNLKSLAHALREDLSHLRELYQQVIYKTTLLTRIEGGGH
jgi:hypothetical protein